MKNIAKEKLKRNELCLGVGLRQSRTVDIGKIMATCDYDWLFIDMEHNSMDIDIASQISVAAQDAGITPIVRVPDFAHHHATRVLDCGAMGIVFPHVDNAKTAEKISSSIESGIVSINQPWMPVVEVPFGGVKDSGYGKELGSEGLEAYMQSKFITQKSSI